MAAWRPAFVGYSDSGAYLGMAMGNVWGASLHPVGYAVFLRDLHALTSAMWPMIALQHLFGQQTGIVAGAGGRDGDQCGCRSRGAIGFAVEDGA